MSTLGEVIAALDNWYPPATAEAWDAVGLTCGDPDTVVHRVLVAVDCVPATVAEAVNAGAQLLLTHHPLLLSAVHGVPTTNPKGALIHRMISSGVAHFAAHTNADVAVGGVSQALAERLELSDVRPLDPDPANPLDYLTVFVPPADIEALVAALGDAGAGAIGDYDRCVFTVEGIGAYRPLPGAHPADGEIGMLSRKPEVRLSMVLPRSRRQAVLAAMRSAHPYEEVAFELTEQPVLGGDAGTGRIGRLATPLRLRDFLSYAADRLPRTVGGLRAAGDPDRLVQTVAVCGGSGASYSELARVAGADAYLTSDLKHHSAVEAVTELGESSMALIDAAHWATEAPWLDSVAAQLESRFVDELDVVVSRIVTDPWTLHQAQLTH
jgi:dinuclear metal center YbgI/SA1388 family protein